MRSDEPATTSPAALHPEAPRLRPQHVPVNIQGEGRCHRAAGSALQQSLAHPHRSLPHTEIRQHLSRDPLTPSFGILGPDLTRFAFRFCAQLYGGIPPTSHPEPAIRLATWNVNSIRARLEIVSNWLGTVAPDVLLLQELKGLDFPFDHFLSLGYHAAAVTQKTYNGVAILSRTPLEIRSTTLPGDTEDSHARFLEVHVPTPAGTPLRVVNLYLPNGNPIGTDKFLYKLGWMDRLAAQMAAWRDDPIPTAIGGDWNVIPEDIDCDKPANWLRDALFQPEVRSRFRDLLATGYTDSFRSLHPAERDLFTYWDYFRNAFERNRGIRIDHFLLSPTLTPHLRSATIDKAPRAEPKPSDHTPMLIELDL